MSKNLTPELLESIMAKVSEQLSEAIRQVMGNFTAVLADLVDRKLADPGSTQWKLTACISLLTLELLLTKPSFP